MFGAEVVFYTVLICPGSSVNELLEDALRKTGAQIVVDALIREGVEVVFGYPGGVVIPVDVLYDTKESNLS